MANQLSLQCEECRNGCEAVAVPLELLHLMSARQPETVMSILHFESVLFYCDKDKQFIQVKH